MRDRSKFPRIGGRPKRSAFKRRSMIEVEDAAAVDDAVNDAACIADALIIQETGPEAHFTAGARNLLRGLVLLHSSHEEG